jgi:hypothetical protein
VPATGTAGKAAGNETDPPPSRLRAAARRIALNPVLAARVSMNATANVTMKSIRRMGRSELSGTGAQLS